MDKTFIFGDIHGCYDELLQLVAQAGIEDSDTVIVTGDIADRGPKPAAVYHWLASRPKSVILAGDLEYRHIHDNPELSGEIVRLQLGKEYPAFREWLTTLPYYHETEEVIVVHAAMIHDLPLHEQPTEVLCGTTEGEAVLMGKYPSGAWWNDFYSGSKMVITGHQFVGEKPEFHGNTCGIDTGVCHGGYLTVIEIPGFIIHQVKASANHWKDVQQEWFLKALQARDWSHTDLSAIREQLVALSHVEQSDVHAFRHTLERQLSRINGLLPALLQRYTKEAHTFKSPTVTTTEHLLLNYPNPQALGILASKLGIHSFPTFQFSGEQDLSN